jgi:uncharacterized Fe-S cluster-containing radical SAM superfamily enzyme
MDKNKCYFCGVDATESTQTVSGKPDDYKVCPDCLLKNMPAIVGARAMLKKYEELYG